jgi:hypothetical protein
MTEVEKPAPGRENEDQEGDLEVEGIRETLLVQMAPQEAAALRELGKMLDHYSKYPREGQETPWARLPYLEFVGVARDLRYLERYLLEIAQNLFEMAEPEGEPQDERSRQWQMFARRHGGELGKLAGELEAKIEELEPQPEGPDSLGPDGSVHQALGASAKDL